MGIIKEQETGGRSGDAATPEYLTRWEEKQGEEEVNLPGAVIMPRHGSVFTHGWCRHLFAQHPSLLQANVTQPTAQNAPATLLNTFELGLSVWGEERDTKIAMLKKPI